MDDVAIDEVLQLPIPRLAGLGEAHQVAGQRVAPGIEVVGRPDAGGLHPSLEPRPRVLDEIGRQRRDHAADQRRPPRSAVAPGGPGGADMARDRQRLDRLFLGQRQAVLEVVRLLRDFVGPVHELRLGRAARLGPQALAKFEREGKRDAPRRVLPDALADVVGQVQARLVVALLEPVHHAHGLEVVLEAAGLRMALAEQPVEHVLAGVTERRVPEIVPERDRFGEVLVQAESARGAAGDLRHLDRMSQARAEMVALVRDEDLRLVFQPAKRARVDDAIAVPDVGRARVPRRGGHGTARTAGPAASRGVDGEALLFEALEMLAGGSGGGGRHALCGARPSAARSRHSASPTR